MKSLQWGKGRSTSKSSAIRPPNKAGRVARTINWKLSVDRSQIGAAAREKYLRSLMGLPATPARDPDKGSGR
jgi:hypothetical protein